MAVRLIIGGFDLSTFIRLPPGENFDPFDSDFLQPQFAESAVGAGDPLLSVKEGNKELVWPIHLTPTKSASYADTPDGLNLMVRDVNRALANAKGTLSGAEWREDGATSSTFMDVTFARFEPDYSAFKARKLWLSGVVRIWSPTYGDWGTVRLLASALGSGLALTVTPTLLALDGDAPAQILSRIGSGSQMTVERRQHPQIVGMAVVPSGYRAWTLPSSFTLEAPSSRYGPGIVSASSIAGSQALRFALANTANTSDTTKTDLFSVTFTPASAYEGRNRVLMLANTHAFPGSFFQAFDGADPQQSLGAEQLATQAAAEGWGVVDLGVWEVSGQARATAQLRVRVQRRHDDVPLGEQWREERGFASQFDYVGGLMVLPEDQSAYVVDVDRSPIGMARPLALAGTGPVGSLAIVDVYGNAISGDVIQFTDGWWAANGAAHTNYVQLETSVEDCHQELALSNSVNFFGNSSAAAATHWVGLGKSEDGGYGEIVTVRMQEATRGLGFLAIAAQVGLGAASIVACAAFPSMVMGNNDIELHFNSSGNQVHGELFSLSSGPIAAVTTAVDEFKYAGMPYAQILQASIADRAAGGAYIEAWRVTQTRASGLAPRSVYAMDGELEAVNREQPSGTWLTALGGRRRGAIPMLRPSVAQQVVVFQLPIDGGRGDDVLDMELRVRERFGYAK